MGFVLKIAIASAALAAAFVHGSEHGPAGTRPATARITAGAPLATEPTAMAAPGPASASSR